jgi:hypothetical protein
MAMAEHRAASILYWSGAVVLVMFGAIAIFSIGAPFFLTGIAMLAAGTKRHDPAVLWPTLLGVWTLVLAYVLIAPWSCTATSSGGGAGAGHTTCTNPLGIGYAGDGLYNPPLLPAFLVGLAAGMIVAIVSRRAVRARGA